MTPNPECGERYKTNDPFNKQMMQGEDEKENQLEIKRDSRSRGEKNCKQKKT